MKIGLYTIHASHNVGAMLQAYALVSFLKENEAEVELVNMYPKSIELQNHHRIKGSFLHNLMRDTYLLMHPSIRVMEQNFDLFHYQMPLSQRFYSQDEYMQNPNNYDLHLVGSDQVWNLQKGYDFSAFYFLDYLPAGSRKVSYGSSFGTTNKVTGVDSAMKALSAFEHISVREDSAAEFVKSHTGKECAHVVDPTLLLNNEQWDKVAGTKPLIKGKYILFYGVNDDTDTWKIINRVKEIYGLPVVGYPGPLIPKYRFDKFILNGGPKQFVNLVKNAEYVITSSFHGLAFSVNFAKKFIVIKYGERMERMESLMRQVNAQDYFAENYEDAERILNAGWDLQSIQRHLHEARRKSICWIKENILEA